MLVTMPCMSTPPDSSKPTGSGAGPVAAGCVASGCLHVVFSFVVAGLGSLLLAGNDGYLMVLPFWVSLGVVQWIYIAPLAMLARRFSRNGLAKGLLIGGGVVALANLTYWLGLGYLGLQSRAEMKQIRKFEQEHPIEHLDVHGTIVAADAGHVEVKTEGGIVSLTIGSYTEFIRLKTNGGYEIATPAIVEVGAEVSIDGSRSRDAPASASILRVKMHDRP